MNLNEKPQAGQLFGWIGVASVCHQVLRFYRPKVADTEGRESRRRQEDSLPLNQKQPGLSPMLPRDFIRGDGRRKQII